MKLIVFSTPSTEIIFFSLFFLRLSIASVFFVCMCCVGRGCVHLSHTDAGCVLYLLVFVSYSSYVGPKSTTLKLNFA